MLFLEIHSMRSIANERQNSSSNNNNSNNVRSVAVEYTTDSINGNRCIFPVDGDAFDRSHASVASTKQKQAKRAQYSFNSFIRLIPLVVCDFKDMDRISRYKIFLVDLQHHTYTYGMKWQKAFSQLRYTLTLILHILFSSILFYTYGSLCCLRMSV